MRLSMFVLFGALLACKATGQTGSAASASSAASGPPKPMLEFVPKLVAMARDPQAFRAKKRDHYVEDGRLTDFYTFSESWLGKDSELSVAVVPTSAWRWVLCPAAIDPATLSPTGSVKLYRKEGTMSAWFAIADGPLAGAFMWRDLSNTQIGCDRIVSADWMASEERARPN